MPIRMSLIFDQGIVNDKHNVGVEDRIPIEWNNHNLLVRQAHFCYRIIQGFPVEPREERKKRELMSSLVVNHRLYKDLVANILVIIRLYSVLIQTSPYIIHSQLIAMSRRYSCCQKQGFTFVQPAIIHKICFGKPLQ